jgi:hypothetical protein
VCDEPARRLIFHACRRIQARRPGRNLYLSCGRVRWRLCRVTLRHADDCILSLQSGNMEKSRRDRTHSVSAASGMMPATGRHRSQSTV